MRYVTNKCDVQVIINGWMPSVPTIIAGNLHQVAVLEDFQVTLVCVAPGRRVRLDQVFSRFLKERKCFC